MHGNTCPAQDFLFSGEVTTKAHREGFGEIMLHVAKYGLNKLPKQWCHEANKANGIYEFRKGPLRLFFFKGNGSDIAVCTTGVRKSGAKADNSAVKASVRWKKNYVAAVANGTYEVIENED